MERAIYAGSFDPFTNGHLDILKKGCKIFSEVHLVIGVNSNKKRTYDINKMKNAIEKTLEKENIKNCKVVIYDELIANYCKENNINFSIRGLRNSMDFDYEENISKINLFVNPSLETIYLRPSKNFEMISSSTIKELNKYGEDVCSLVPKDVYLVIKGENL